MYCISEQLCRSCSYWVPQPSTQVDALQDVREAMQGRRQATDGKGQATEGKGPAPEGKGPATEDKGPATEGKGQATVGTDLVARHLGLAPPARAAYCHFFLTALCTSCRAGPLMASRLTHMRALGQSLMAGLATAKQLALVCFRCLHQ